MEKAINTRTFVILIIFSQLLTAFVGRSLNPFAIYIGDSLQLTNFQLGFLPTALFLGQFLATLPMGFFADYIATHRLLLLLMLTVGGGFFLFATVQNTYIVALLFITLAGLGYGGMHPVTNKMLIQLYPVQKVTFPMGLKQMSITLGSALSSILLLALAEKIGWQWAVKGAAIGLLVFAFIVYNMMQAYSGVFSTLRSTESSLLGQLKKLFTSKMLFFTTFVALLLMGMQVTFNTYLLLFLSGAKGWSIYIAGLALAFSEICGAAGRVLWGMMSDAWFNGNRWIVLMIITAWFPIALWALYEINESWITVIIIASVGFTLSGFNGVWMNLAVESVPRSIGGSASGYSVTFASVGVFILPPVFGYLTDMAGYLYGGIFLAGSSALCLMILGWVFMSSKRVANI